MCEERVILVDAMDVAYGTAEKLSAHVDGVLHRAFSVLVFNPRGDLLLQRRAMRKYHSGGLWSNTCCGHPRPGEDTTAAAQRRLYEEMGFGCKLTSLFGFHYHAELDRGMVEHEYDHVLIGRYDGDAQPNSSEVEAWRWAPLSAVMKGAAEQPELYTYWFRLLLARLPSRLSA